MRLQLNFKSGKPVYLQIVDQVKSLITARRRTIDGFLLVIRNRQPISLTCVSHR